MSHNTKTMPISILPYARRAEFARQLYAWHDAVRALPDGWRGDADGFRNHRLPALDVCFLSAAQLRACYGLLKNSTYRGGNIEQMQKFVAGGCKSVFTSRIKPKAGKKTLTRDDDIRPMSCMLGNAEFAEPDVDLVAADGSIVPAHRLVLSVRSEWFRTVIERVQSNDRRIRVEVPPAPTGELLELAVRMVYDNSIVRPMDEVTAAKLMHVMDFVCAHALKADIASVVEGAKLTDANVGLLLHTAERFDMAKLLKRALGYVAKSEPRGDDWEAVCLEHPDVRFAAHIAKRAKFIE